MIRKCETHTITAGPKIVKTVVFGGETHILTLHIVTYSYPDFSFNQVEKVVNEQGREVTGIWRYAGTQTTCIDRLKFDLNSAREIQFLPIQRSSESDGSDPYKYLVKIVEKPEDKSA